MSGRYKRAGGGLRTTLEAALREALPEYLAGGPRMSREIKRELEKALSKIVNDPESGIVAEPFAIDDRRRIAPRSSAHVRYAIGTSVTRPNADEVLLGHPLGTSHSVDVPFGNTPTGSGSPRKRGSRAVGKRAKVASMCPICDHTIEPGELIRRVAAATIDGVKSPGGWAHADRCPALAEATRRSRHGANGRAEALARIATLPLERVLEALDDPDSYRHEYGEANAEAIEHALIARETELRAGLCALCGEAIEQGSPTLPTKRGDHAHAACSEAEL